MKRSCAVAALAWASLLLFTGSAGAAAPSLGTVSATNLQGVSALLVGSVDPEGLATTYRYEYSTSPSFAGSVKTSSSEAGSGNDPVPARAALAGLHPDTTYHFRLVATNSSATATGAPGSFTTTHGFGFLPGTAGFAASIRADGGAPADRIGSHPYQLDLEIGLNVGGEFEGQPGALFPDGDLRDLEIEMPPGLLLNPSVVSPCGLADFHTPRVSPFEESRSGESCPDRSQVGTVEVQSSREGGQVRRFGLFNLAPAPGVAAQLGTAPYGARIVFDLHLRPRTDGSYTLALLAREVPQALDFHGIGLSLWGTPWGASHNGERGNCLNEAEPSFPWAKCAVGEPASEVPLAFLTLPSQCGGPLAFTAAADAWQQGAEMTAQAVNRDSEGAQVDLSDCSGLPFSPRPIAQLTNTRASSPSGFAFDLENDLEALLDPDARAPSQTREIVVTLPAGVNINPSVGAGLGVCSEAQYAAESAFSVEGAGCPNESKIGDFEVVTPLFTGRLEGAVYLATPYANPLGSLVAIYLVARLPERGIVVKMPGRLSPDPGTGNLTATFAPLPQLPYTDLTMSFRAGQRSLLVTPASCGTATARSEAVPWAGTPSFITLSQSPITAGVGGGACPPPAGPPPFAPGVIAGGVNSNVNSYTPYFIHIARQDTEQEITSYSLVLPEGITGKLAGIPFCPEAAIEAARRNSGDAEEHGPSCPAASEIGRVQTGYGVGSSLTYTSGRIYLAGPHNGRPLSVVVINPATVGPFDLGVVVVRSALSVNQRTAQLQIDSSASDRIPHILAGIPLRLRDIRIHLDRYQFTHNPSSCAASQLVSTIGGSGAQFDSFADDSLATATAYFQLLNCRVLGFKPKLGIRLRGGTRRGAYPQLRVTFAARGQSDTNLKEIAVSMPHSLFLAQNHIEGICTKPQFNAERCPPDSVYGKAVAHTPLFDEPLRGNVYLRSSSGALPDLVASLYSGAVNIILEGEIGPTRHGGIRALFRGLPDQPVDRFVMTLQGGRQGLLQNSSNICKEPPLATVSALGQTNLGRKFTTVLRGQCRKKAKRPKRHRTGGGR
jgi:hypothetical protein